MPPWPPPPPGYGLDIIKFMFMLGRGGAYVPGTLLDVYLAEKLLLVLYQQVFQSSLKISQTGVS